MATVKIYIYRVGGEVSSCPVCSVWEGEESRDRADLPAIPNPACLAGSHNCHCFVVEVAKEEDEKDEQRSGGGGGADRGGDNFIIIDRGGGGRGGGGGGGGGDGDISVDWDPYDDYWVE